MKTELKDLDIPTESKKLVNDIRKTRNPHVLREVVKAGIFRRDQLLEKDPEEPQYRLDKLDSKTRQRAKRLLARVEGLEDRKSVSVLCAAAIQQRKECRGE